MKSNQHYEDADAADIRTYYPRAADDISGVFRTYDQDETGPGFGINLASSRPAPWIDLRFNGNFNHPDQSSAYIEANIVNPSRVGIMADFGRTALIDAVYLDVGDSFTIGRKKYRDLGNFVSMQHLRLDVVNVPGRRSQKVGVTVTDLQSTNGTRIFLPGLPGQDHTTRTQTGPVEPPEDLTGLYNPEAVNNIEFLRFKAKYQTEFPNLSDADFLFCVYVCQDLTLRFNKDDKQFVKEFNKAVHPDRHPNVSPRVAHEIFNLCQKELGL